MLLFPEKKTGTQNRLSPCFLMYVKSSFQLDNRLLYLHEIDHFHLDFPVVHRIPAQQLAAVVVID